MGEQGIYGVVKRGQGKNNERNSVRDVSAPQVYTQGIGVDGCINRPGYTQDFSPRTYVVNAVIVGNCRTTGDLLLKDLSLLFATNYTLFSKHLSWGG
jgi:hypothetical protein